MLNLQRTYWDVTLSSVRKVCTVQLSREEKGPHVKGKGMEGVCSHDYQPDLSFLDFLISQTSKITHTHTHTHTYTANSTVNYIHVHAC